MIVAVERGERAGYELASSPSRDHTSARRTTIAAAAAMSWTEAHSRTEWYSWPPVKMFGVGQPHLAQPRAVGAAADRAADRLDPLGSDRRLGGVGRPPAPRSRKRRMLRYCSRTSISRRARGSAADDLAARSARAGATWRSSSVVVEVAHDEAHLRLPGGRRSARTGWMNPSRSAVVSGVSVSDGSAATICAASRSALTSLPVAWPGCTSTPRTVSDHLERAERLVLELAELGAVERVGAARAEALDVEQRRALADLLVRREGDPQRRPRQLGMRGEVARPRP